MFVITLRDLFITPGLGTAFNRLLWMLHCVLMILWYNAYL